MNILNQIKLGNFSADIKQLENFYLLAKAEYYKGTPIMSDPQFDVFEAYLKFLNSPVINQVGFKDQDRNAKFLHPTPMLSLEKFQAGQDGTIPELEFHNWAQQKGVDEYEASPKFDGNAINMIYKNGKLFVVLSRGDKNSGRDYTSKFINKVPNTIPYMGTVEIRGECVIKTSVFNEKYSSAKNARNFVAGVLTKEDGDPREGDLVFMAFEGKESSGEGVRYLKTNVLSEIGFNTEVELFSMVFQPKHFVQIYKKFEDYRKNSPFLLDGFVIKAPEESRKEIGETDHHPKWAIAIKFPAVEAITKNKSIRWTIGKTGALIPTALLEPVNIDGSTVAKASLYNYQYVIDNGAYPGATVVIAKAGDIIPEVQEVLEIGDPNSDWAPKECPFCEHTVVIEGPHLMCKNDNCEGKALVKLVKSIKIFDLADIGPAIAEKLFDAGVVHASDLFNPTIVSTILNGDFKEGKALDNIVKAIKTVKTKGITLQNLIASMGFVFVGIGKTSEHIAKKIAGIPYSYFGLASKATEGFEIDETKYNETMEMIEKLNGFGVEVKFPTEAPVVVGAINFEMTGSPKDFGYATKEQFVDLMKKFGFVHTDIKDAKVLFTDSLTGASSKMAKAQKMKIQIAEYPSPNAMEKFVEELKAKISL